MGVVMESLCPVTGETHEEERINWLTHLAGLLFSCIGGVLLFLTVNLIGDPVHIVSCSIYAATLILLFAASTFYHACKTVSMKRLMKIADHSCIYLLIAGSYTPFTLGPLKEYGGIQLLVIVWSIAVVGILFKIVAVNRFKTLSLMAYLGMGWMIVFQFPTLIQELSLTASILLICGGLFYSLGTIFYVWDSLPYNHGIWHLFVLGGSFCHFYCIFNMVLDSGAV